MLEGSSPMTHDFQLPLYLTRTVHTQEQKEKNIDGSSLEPDCHILDLKSQDSRGDEHRAAELMLASSIAVSVRCQLT